MERVKLFFGKRGYIMTHPRPLITVLGRRAEDNRRQQEDSSRDGRNAFKKQVQGRLASLGIVSPGEVVVGLVHRGLGDEVGKAIEGFQLVELAFDGIVDALDIRVFVGAADVVEAVLGTEFAFDGVHETVGGVIQPIAAELGTVVGGEDQIPNADKPQPNREL